MAQSKTHAGADKGPKMRATALLFLLCISSEAANAQTTEQCQPMQRAGDLLDCYNGIARAHTPRKLKPLEASTVSDKPTVSELPITVDKPAAPKTPTGRGERDVDVLDAENSKIGAKMKTICRGC
jgi:hypothetical protein